MRAIRLCWHAPMLCVCSSIDAGAACGKASRRVRFTHWANGPRPANILANTCAYIFVFWVTSPFECTPTIWLILSVGILMKLQAHSIGVPWILLMLHVCEGVEVGTTGCGWRCTDVGLRKGPRSWL